MMSALDDVLAANKRYAASFGKGSLAAAPARRFAILTCMDARMDPSKFAGLAEGDAHVIRNAGGRASDDAIRSLIISYKLLGTREWFVIHHTDCGMLQITDETIRSLLAESLAPAIFEETGWRNTDLMPAGNREGDSISWLTTSDQEGGLVEDVTRIRNHPLVRGDIRIHGFVYDVRSGRLAEVREATEAGLPRT
jgi:carbonic anhydrase